jgi:hypothetical protein
MRLQLSGPEVVALAVHSGKIWPAAVTGLDYGNQGLLQEFVLDGTRSLLSRGLADVDGGRVAIDSRLIRSLRPVFSSSGVCAFVGTAEDVAEIAGGAIYLYPDGEDCIVEVVRASGQRELLGLSKSRAIQLLQIFAESVFQSPHREEDPSDLVVYVGAPVAPDLPVSVVRPGRISHGVAPKAGGPVVGAEDTDHWDADWIIRLVNQTAEA